MPSQQAHLGRRGATPIHDDARGETFQRGGAWHAAYNRLIHALEPVSRVGQAFGQLAVIGQQQQPLRIVIKTTDRVHVLAHARDEVENGSPPLWIVTGRYVSRGLVHQHIAAPLGVADPASIDANVITLWIRPGAQLGHDRAIDRYTARLDEPLRRAP